MLVWLLLPSLAPPTLRIFPLSCLTLCLRLYLFSRSLAVSLLLFSFLAFWHCILYWFFPSSRLGPDLHLCLLILFLSSMLWALSLIFFNFFFAWLFFFCLLGSVGDGCVVISPHFTTVRAGITIRTGSVTRTGIMMMRTGVVSRIRMVAAPS